MYKRTNLKSIHWLFFFFLLVLCPNDLRAQSKVGLVLSGGGVNGFAHIGVMQALEEKGVPIDYITGTSAGALIGGLYAVGYSPAEIKTYVLHPDFQLMATGGLRPEQSHISQADDQDAGMFSIAFTADSLWQKSLPTNLTSSAFLDYQLFQIFGRKGAQHNNDFDQLFVPFRCLASDIVAKKSVVFDQGPLNEAIRASMTFPFYFQPLYVNGRLLFDGGLYNNFPADVMYQTFSPDFIIGSNVSYNAEKPAEDDLISQVTNMLVYYSNFELPCEQGCLIEPNINLSTFEFESVEQAIDSGYAKGLVMADSILKFVARKVDSEELKQKREAFRSIEEPVQIREIHISQDNEVAFFVKRTLVGRSKLFSLDPKELEKQYFQLAGTEQIDFLFATLENRAEGGHAMRLEVRKSKPWKLNLGGHISSRPVNTGYVGLTYRLLKKRSIKFHGETYFGKFYGSAHANIKLQFPSRIPVTIEPYYTRNRWDYFTSFATFFEETKPSFLVQYENYTGLRISHPIENNVVSQYDFRYFNNEDDYYQSENYGPSDTTDKTFFEGNSISWQIKHNSLNRKQWATSGHYYRIQARFVNGREISRSGSTAPEPYDFRKIHSWLNLNFEGQSFVLDWPVFHLGIQGKAVFNSQSLFANYTASLLQLTTFDLLPDVNTYFLPEYRSPLFFGGGVNVVFTLRKSLDLRFDGFAYQPLTTLQRRDDGTFGYSKPFQGETLLASASLVYTTFVGPVRATVNYFPRYFIPVSFQLSFGYVIFNERANR